LKIFNRSEENLPELSLHSVRGHADNNSAEGRKDEDKDDNNGHFRLRGCGYCGLRGGSGEQFGEKNAQKAHEQGDERHR
jgi:hypothetical protein